MTDLQTSRERLVLTREEERRRLRRDLHDGLGSALTSLSFNLDAARNLLSQDPIATDALLVELKAQTQAAIADIRRLIYDLRPPALDELGLIPALQQYVDRVNRPADLSVSIHAADDLPMLPAAVEVAAYRIILEALTNIIRHANAKNSTICLSLPDPTTLALDIVDDGTGLASGKPPGIGISTMRERAEELGGSLLIEPIPSGGTRVVVKLPLLKYVQKN
jgi:signal transduction histidine kinase